MRHGHTLATVIVSRLVEPQTLALSILPQPDDATCGPTCLHAVYGYYGDRLPLEDVIAETPTLPGGGTLGAYLGCHALRRGYKAKLYTFDLSVFDVTWFAPGVDLAAKLTDERAAALAKEEGSARLAQWEKDASAAKLGAAVKVSRVDPQGRCAGG